MRPVTAPNRDSAARWLANFVQSSPSHFTSRTLGGSCAQPEVSARNKQQRKHRSHRGWRCMYRFAVFYVALQTLHFVRARNVRKTAAVRKRTLFYCHRALAVLHADSSEIAVTEKDACVWKETAWGKLKQLKNCKFHIWSWRHFLFCCLWDLSQVRSSVTLSQPTSDTVSSGGNSSQHRALSQA